MNSQSYSTRFQPKTAPMVVGGVLLGAGAILGVSGVIVGCTGMFSAARTWWRDMAGQAQQAAKPAWSKSAKETISMGTKAMSGNGTPVRSGRG